MSATTKRDAVDAAMSVAEDVAEGKIDPSTLDQAVAKECRELFGTVLGEGDPLWPLHIDVTRQVLADGGLSADELSEWLAVARSRAGELVRGPQPANDLLLADSPASVALSPQIDLLEPDPGDGEREHDSEPGAEPTAADEGECGCRDSNPAMFELPDGRRIPSRLIIARGRGLPDPNYIV